MLRPGIEKLDVEGAIDELVRFFIHRDEHVGDLIERHLSLFADCCCFWGKETFC